MATVAGHHSVKRGLDASERILQENPDRFAMFPIHFDSMWRGFKRTETAFWTAEDIDLSKDPADWAALSEAERKSLSATLAYLVTSDTALLENLALRFMEDVEQPEARAFYSFQVFKQGVHMEAYGLAVAALVEDPDDQAALFSAQRAHAAMQRKAEWAKRWTQSEEPFAERLVAFAAMESVFYCSSFLSCFELKRRGVMPGVTFATDLVSRDEGINVEFAGIIYSELENKLPQERLRGILGEAVEIEKEFAQECIGVEALGLKRADVEKYIEFVADQLAATLGHERLFKAPNPYDWLETIAFKGKEQKAAALDTKSTNMSMAGVLKQVETRSYTLNFDEDF